MLNLTFIQCCIIFLVINSFNHFGYFIFSGDYFNRSIGNVTKLGLWGILTIARLLGLESHDCWILYVFIFFGIIFTHQRSLRAILDYENSASQLYCAELEMSRIENI